MVIQIPDCTLDDWLAELKPYQCATLAQFLKTCTPEQTAEKWLSTAGSENIAHFGGIRDSKPFWRRFCEEFKRFICDESAYVNEKQALSTEGPVAKAFLISTISAAIGACLGYSATLLAPAVTLLLYAVGRVGLTAYCRVSDEKTESA